MKKVKVLRTYYQRAQQNDLSLIASRTVRRGKDVTAYEPVKPALDVLEPLAESYTIALEDALDGSTANVALKDQLKGKVIEALDDVADLVDLNANDNPLYVINLGLKVQEGGVTHEGDPDSPANFKAETTLTPGEVLVTYEILQPTIVTNVVFEWSADNGVTWNNGQQTSQKSRYLLTGLPSRTEILVRCYCVATRNRKSGFTQHFPVFVL